jgi:hypothetical protein
LASRRLAELSGPVTMKKFRDYCSSEQLTRDLAHFIFTPLSTRPFPYPEGAIRAGLFAVLRLRLPNTWVVSAECPYPPHQGYTDHRADVLCSPKATREKTEIVFEVKPEFLNGDKVRTDLRKVDSHVNMSSSNLKYGYVLVGIKDGDEMKAAEKSLAAWLDPKRPVRAILLPLKFRAGHS